MTELGHSVEPEGSWTNKTIVDDFKYPTIVLFLSYNCIMGYLGKTPRDKYHVRVKSRIFLAVYENK